MNQEDKFTVTISVKIDRRTGGADKEGVMANMDVVYNNMNYGDVVGVEAIVVESLLPALVGAGFVQAEAMGLDMDPVRNMVNAKKPK